MRGQKLGFRHSEETKRKISLAHLGKPNLLARKEPVQLTCRECKEPYLVQPYRKAQSRFCSALCRNRNNLLNADTSHRHRSKNKGRKRPDLALRNRLFPRRGPDSANWRGGLTPFHKAIRALSKYFEWRDAIYKRDNYTCRLCGRRGGELHADHIRPFVYILAEHHIRTLEQAEKCAELWDLNNGRTLCVPCHRKTPTYGRGAKLNALL